MKYWHNAKLLQVPLVCPLNQESHISDWLMLCFYPFMLVLMLLPQEVQVKKYKQQMEETLADFYQTYSQVEPAMRPLLKQYTEEVIK